MQTSVQQLSDQEILQRIKHNSALSPQLINSIYQEKGAKGYYFILRESKNEDMAKEMLQDAIVSFVCQVKTGKLVSVKSLSAYLYQICRNSWINLKKKHKALLQDLTSLANTHIDEEYASDKLERQERAALINQLLNLAKETCRQVLMWAIVEKRPMDWIAKQLGLGSAQAAMNRNYRCKKELVQLVNGNTSRLQLVQQLLTESKERAPW